MATIRLGERDFEVVPLRLGALKRLAAAGHLEKVSSWNGQGLTVEQLSAVTALLVETVRPAVDGAWLDENVLPGQIAPAFKTIMEVSAPGTASPNAVSP